MNNNTLGSSIAVMNAKGGVGKSTVTLAIAETLSYYYDKKVLVIDSDAQMSISVMLMPFETLNQKRAGWKTLVGLLHQTLILGDAPDWKDFVTPAVGDVDDTDTIDLLPGDLRLTLVERAVTEADRHEQMRGLVRSVLAEARLNYDFVLIDCPPGLSLLTEIWLREADYHLAPAKPDFLAIAGLEMFREFKKINPDLKMAENLGILVNMKSSHSAEDDNYHAILASDEESRCFPDAIPHMAPIQHAARFNAESRSFMAKYPGAAGEAFRNTVRELLQRTSEGRAQQVDSTPVQEEPVAQEVQLPEQSVADSQIQEEMSIEPVPVIEETVAVTPQTPAAAPIDRKSPPAALDAAPAGFAAPPPPVSPRATPAARPGAAPGFARKPAGADQLSAQGSETPAFAPQEGGRPRPAPAPLSSPEGDGASGLLVEKSASWEAR